jgi:hypothetical protein
MTNPLGPPTIDLELSESSAEVDELLGIMPSSEPWGWMPIFPIGGGHCAQLSAKKPDHPSVLTTWRTQGPNPVVTCWLPPFNLAGPPWSWWAWDLTRAEFVEAMRKR